jgi:hypothetical protein
VNEKQLKELKRDAERYRFLRDEENWGVDENEWETLGELTFDEFDVFVDEKMEKEGYL